MELPAYLRDRLRAIDRALSGYLPKSRTRPTRLHEAMRYSLFAGGKRMRPVLCLAAAEACGGTIDDAMPAACAVECLHTYSLIHDDLPCMDDDDFRRGRPTAHKQFGEAVAVLAGDALLTIAFEILSKTRPTSRYPVANFIQQLAIAGGSLNLIAGQVADLEGEGQDASTSLLRFIHARKTGALLVASIRLGAMSANAKPAQLKALSDFGSHLGLAFQVIDDILDVTGSAEKLGKTAGKDVAAGKMTYPAVMGLDASKREAHKLTTRALSALAPFKAKGETLRSIAQHLLGRDT